ncbi:MAG: acyl-CoA dehydrogenase C-terminal domain-containing protein, partial [Pseudomonadota bacterium]
NGAAFRALGEEIRTTIAAEPRLPEQEAALGEALALAEKTTMAMIDASTSAGPEAFLANASVYLDMLGHVVIAWIWLKQAKAAEADVVPPALAAGKRAACQYFYRYELPTIEPQCTLLARLDRTSLDVTAEAL